MRTVLVTRSPVRSHRRGRAAALACTLLLAGCLPVPGGGWVPGGPDAAMPQDGSDGADAAGGAGPGGVSAGAPRCVAAGTGPLEARPVPIVRPVAAPSGPPVPMLVQLDAGRVADLALGTSEGRTCANRVVLVTSSDPTLRALAGTHAVLEGLPLMLAPSPPRTEAGRVALLGRLDALGVVEVVLYGVEPAWAEPLGARIVERTEPGADVLGRALALALDLVLVLEQDLMAQADVVAHAAGGSVPVVLPSGGDAGSPMGDALLVELLALDPPHSVSWAASTPAHARMLSELLSGDERPRWDAPSDAGVTAELWLGDARDGEAALAAAVVAAARGAAFVAVDGADLRGGVGRTARMRAAHAHPDGPADVVLVGGVESHTVWQLDTVLAGTPLPGGGFRPLEDRRIVALYGSPDTPSLGLLGAQDDEATIVRAGDVAARYADAPDGRTVVAGLDVIATVASAAAEPTGDYSRRIPIARLRPLVELAHEAGMAVFLDLQPGRASFLGQAQEYEELLREPHVHLALDPEWRLGPGERHLVRIGSVAASEVQEVADWLADLVRRERLPQKVLMLHQFTTAMLPDRDTIILPAELVGVIHVDGQGALPNKNRTYAAITDGAEGHWAWGWKNFTRIDVPVATPEQSLDRVPVPVVVTYQ